MRISWKDLRIEEGSEDYKMSKKKLERGKVERESEGRRVCGEFEMVENDH